MLPCVKVTAAGDLDRRPKPHTYRASALSVATFLEVGRGSAIHPNMRRPHRVASIYCGHNGRATPKALKYNSRRRRPGFRHRRDDTRVLLPPHARYCSIAAPRVWITLEFMRDENQIGRTVDAFGQSIITATPVLLTASRYMSERGTDGVRDWTKKEGLPEGVVRREMERRAGVELPLLVSTGAVLAPKNP